MCRSPRNCWARSCGAIATRRFRDFANPPGSRKSVKVAVVDATGKIVETTAIYPHEPQRRWDESVALLAALAHRHKADLIAIGNGTASRETDKLAGDLIARHPELKLAKVVVSEAGASVYSASAYAAEELPNLEVTLRGAASIARRLQDPLAEPSRSIPSRSASASTSTTSPNRSSAARSTRWSRTASTRWASTSTPPRRSCSLGFRASARRSPRRSSSIARRTGRSAIATR